MVEKSIKEMKIERVSSLSSLNSVFKKKYICVADS